MRRVEILAISNKHVENLSYWVDTSTLYIYSTPYLGTLGPSPIDSTSKVGYIRVESKILMSAVYLPSIYRGGKQRTQKITLPLYIPNFTLISDLVSDLGVTSGLFGEV